MAQSPLSAAMPNGDLVDVNNDVTPEWHAFFVRLLTRTGGTQGVDTGALQQQINTETAQRTAADAALHSELTSVSNAGASTASSLNASIAAEASTRAYADSQLLPKNGGVTGLIGFQGSPPISRPTVTGAKGGNAALASLLSALATYGLITDSST